MPTWKRLLIAWFFVPVHRLLFRISNGRLLGRLEGTGVLILVTKGRKSGKPRSSPLAVLPVRGVRRPESSSLRTTAGTAIPRGT